MNDYLVTCTATGDAADAMDLGVKVSQLVLNLGAFGALGRLAKDGTMYEATLVVAAGDEAEARRVAQSAVLMAGASIHMPKWAIVVTECFALAAA